MQKMLGNSGIEQAPSRSGRGGRRFESYHSDHVFPASDENFAQVAAQARKFKRHYPHAGREITRHGKEAWYYRRGKGKRYRLPGRPFSPGFDEAYGAIEAYVKTGAPVGLPSFQPASRLSVKQQVGVAIAKGVMQARQRAAAKGVPFDLTAEFLLRKAEAARFRCELTGIEFYSPHRSAGRINPFRPSIDRINPRRGYTEDNVRVVVFAINAMLFDWGEETFVRVANAYRTRLRDRPTPAPAWAAGKGART
jgi:hypothetical protein